MATTKYNIHEWLKENQKYFAPPICNKLMYKDGQLKTFFVGGPNSRKDFHMEEGEEFFYMLKGDMKLVVFERDKFRDIIIKEGEVFLLPAHIPHSPQRLSDTIGLVIERERTPDELDCLRYYVEGSTDILYEKYFYCQSLEELGPLIKEYFGSEQYKTGRPVPGTLLEDKPIKQDFQRELGTPFSLRKFLQNNESELNIKGKVKLFSGNYKSPIHLLGKGYHSSEADLPETFLWQIEGSSSIQLSNTKYELSTDDTLLISASEKYVISANDSSRMLSVVMNPI